MFETMHIQIQRFIVPCSDSYGKKWYTFSQNTVVQTSKWIKIWRIVGYSFSDEGLPHLLSDPSKRGLALDLLLVCFTFLLLPTLEKQATDRKKKKSIQKASHMTTNTVLHNVHRALRLLAVTAVCYSLVKLQAISEAESNTEIRWQKRISGMRRGYQPQFFQKHCFQIHKLVNWATGSELFPRCLYFLEKSIKIIELAFNPFRSGCFTTHLPKVLLTGAYKIKTNSEEHLVYE